MVDTSLFSGMIFSWGNSIFVWTIVIAIAVVIIGGILYINKRRKLKYNVLELVPFGNGKFGFNLGKAGLFSSSSSLGGLWDNKKGDRYKTAKGNLIIGATTEDLHDIFGKKGFIVMRHPEDPQAVIPISKAEIINRDIFLELAPIDIRDAGVELMKENIKETQGWIDKYGAIISIGLLVMLGVIGFVVAGQVFNHAIDKSMEIQQMTCSNSVHSSPSTAP